MSSRYTHFTNAYLVLPTGQLTTAPSELWTDNITGKILHIENPDQYDYESSPVSNGDGEKFRTPDNETTVVDVDGEILAPGLIDIQINGAFNVDFSEFDGDEEAYLAGVDRVGRGLCMTGVTSYLPTVISQVPETYPSLLPLLDPTTPHYTSRFQSPSSIATTVPGANVLGYHLEGPFLSPHKPGCHPPDNLIPAPEGFASIEKVFGEGSMRLPEQREVHTEMECVKLVTLAPEVEGVGKAIRDLVARGWVVSLGHSNATTEQATRAVSSGATCITHLFNAMPQLHHREPGIIGLLAIPPRLPPPSSYRDFHRSRTVHSIASSPARRSISHSHPRIPTRRNSPDSDKLTPLNVCALDHALSQERSKPRPLQFGETRIEGIDGLIGKDVLDIRKPYWSIIADGIHCHPQSVNFAFRAHREGCVLVTDAVRLMDPNLPDGTYPWRESSSILKSGDSITLSGTNTLAGAAVSLDTCVRNMSAFASIPLSEAIVCASGNAARALGEKVAVRKGELRVGMDADLGVWSREAGRVLQTWVMGRRAYKAGGKTA